MLRKEYIEKAIRDLQKEMEKIGMYISEITVRDPKIITELEKVTIVQGLRPTLKPAFVSNKNYRKAKIPDHLYGFIYGIKIKRGELDGKNKTGQSESVDKTST